MHQRNPDITAASMTKTKPQNWKPVSFETVNRIPTEITKIIPKRLRLGDSNLINKHSTIISEQQGAWERIQWILRKTENGAAGIRDIWRQLAICGYSEHVTWTLRFNYLCLTVLTLPYINKSDTMILKTNVEHCQKDYIPVYETLFQVHVTYLIPRLKVS